MNPKMCISSGDASVDEDFVRTLQYSKINPCFPLCTTSTASTLHIKFRVAVWSRFCDNIVVYNF